MEKMRTKTRPTKIQIDILKRWNLNDLKRIKHLYDGTRKTKTSKRRRQTTEKIKHNLSVREQ